jgi:hypothetical protein
MDHEELIDCEAVRFDVEPNGKMRSMQTDALQPDDEQSKAVEYLLAAAPDCGLHRLSAEELLRLCARILRALDKAESQAFSNGWNSGWRQAVEFTTSQPVKSPAGH